MYLKLDLWLRCPKCHVRAGPSLEAASESLMRARWLWLPPAGGGEDATLPGLQQRRASCQQGAGGSWAGHPLALAQAPTQIDPLHQVMSRSSTSCDMCHSSVPCGACAQRGGPGAPCRAGCTSFIRLWHALCLAYAPPVCLAYAPPVEPCWVAGCRPCWRQLLPQHCTTQTSSTLTHTR